MKRAYSPVEILKMKKKTFPLEGEWQEAFGAPETTGVWFIWGNSGNGKTSFVMQLCKILAQFGVVAYDSLEEGASLSMLNMLQRYNMQEVNRRFYLLDCESMEDLDKRLNRHKSPKFIVIDSIQYSQMTYRQYLRFKEAHRDKLIIFISHADGNNPSGRSAKQIMYDASLKIWVQGYRAFSKGRFIGSLGYFDIWQEGARKYWGEEQL